MKNFVMNDAMSYKKRLQQFKVNRDSKLKNLIKSLLLNLEKQPEILIRQAKNEDDLGIIGYATNFYKKQ